MGQRFCKECQTAMKPISGGVDTGKFDSYIVYSCPKCDMCLKEVTKSEWAQGLEFKELK